MSIAFTVIESEGLSVLRDDLLPGGTKRRGLERLLKDIPQNDLTYAGTIFGHGALALAEACKAGGKKAHLFLAANDPYHFMLEKIRAANGNIHQAEPLPVLMLHDHAAQWSKENDACLFPLAFDAPDFHAAMQAALSTFDISPYSEIWCSSVSGTLAKGLRLAFPDTPLKTVSVAAKQTATFSAPEKYHQPAKLPPPYPSCAYTDAKVWQFARSHAAPDALIWNTAG